MTTGRTGLAKAANRLKPDTGESPFSSKLDLEIIPDSEEERKKVESYNTADVIELSSDEDDTLYQLSSDIPLPTRKPRSWPEDTGDVKLKSSTSKNPLMLESIKFTPRRTHRTRRIIESSDSENYDDVGGHATAVSPEVIELSDSSPEQSNYYGTSIRKSTPKIGALLSDEEDTWSDDSAVLVLDEPRSARKPVRLTSSNIQDPTRPPARGKQPEDLWLHSRKTLVPSGAIRQKVPDSPSTPLSNASPSRANPMRSPVKGKKALADAEKKKRELYAQQIFVQLNRVVFKDGLPRETKLNWSKRLLTTAGRAKWHRSRDGTQTTEIELAEKILDCEERIRNTLSHEMCHLATWIIDGSTKEAHGALWKAWAAKVMRKHPEIDITTRHDYEISYPFEWKCELCAKSYGRFSKSIRPDEVVCGACKEGKLLPQFTQRPPKTPKTQKTSQMASVKPQGIVITPQFRHLAEFPFEDSPHSLPRGDAGDNGKTVSLGSPIHDINDSGSKPDVALLTTALRSITIKSYE